MLLHLRRFARWRGSLPPRPPARIGCSSFLACPNRFIGASFANTATPPIEWGPELDLALEQHTRDHPAQAVIVEKREREPEMPVGLRQMFLDVAAGQYKTTAMDEELDKVYHALAELLRPHEFAMIASRLLALQMRIRKELTEPDGFSSKPNRTASYFSVTYSKFRQQLSKDLSVATVNSVMHLIDDSFELVNVKDLMRVGELHAKPGKEEMVRVLCGILDSVTFQEVYDSLQRHEAFANHRPYELGKIVQRVTELLIEAGYVENLRVDQLKGFTKKAIVRKRVKEVLYTRRRQRSNEGAKIDPWSKDAMLILPEFEGLRNRHGGVVDPLLLHNLVWVSSSELATRRKMFLESRHSEVVNKILTYMKGKHLNWAFKQLESLQHNLSVVTMVAQTNNFPDQYGALKSERNMYMGFTKNLVAQLDDLVPGDDTFLQISGLTLDELAEHSQLMDPEHMYRAYRVMNPHSTLAPPKATSALLELEGGDVDGSGTGTLGASTGINDFVCLLLLCLDDKALAAFMHQLGQFTNVVHHKNKTQNSFLKTSENIFGDHAHLLMAGLEKYCMHLSEAFINRVREETIEFSHHAYLAAFRKPSPRIGGERDDASMDREAVLGTFDMTADSRKGENWIRGYSATGGIHGVFVRNLPATVTPSKLIRSFDPSCGRVIGIEIYKDQLKWDMLMGEAPEEDKNKFRFRDSTWSPVYGFVYFADDNGRDMALATDMRVFGVSIDSNICRTEPVSSKTILHVGNLPNDRHFEEIAYLLHTCVYNKLPNHGHISRIFLPDINKEHVSSMDEKQHIKDHRRVAYPNLASEKASSHCFVQFDSHLSAHLAYRLLAHSDQLGSIRVGWADSRVKPSYVALDDDDEEDEMPEQEMTTKSKKKKSKK